MNPFVIKLKTMQIKHDILREKLTFGINLGIQRMIERSKKLDEKIVISKDNKVLIIRALDL